MSYICWFVLFICFGVCLIVCLCYEFVACLFDILCNFVCLVLVKFVFAFLLGVVYLGVVDLYLLFVFACLFEFW